ncbi:acyl carrier protein, putative [Metamycoplasma arthritidis]|uniref:Acyl carrier protein, putative n=1 Tax=Metamycoplasma arthritidis (strain 158L3-1) TaxID=243272 RepID=B3PMD4_META1|nr:phosphopantetheine-binding protein [Metamycoplasma arthritidis]ACF07186.1 acyl carrier protein, putative [Metamycoplasma arthritidis 158L3-1]VEU78710.1 acyl carrier protein, putative [Metamycoplasma arthritidis]
MDIQKLVFNEIKKLTRNSFDASSSLKDLDIDSLDFIVLVTSVEEKYNITISDDELMKLKTIQDIIDCLNKKLN